MRGIDRHQPDTVMVITDAAVETVDPFVIADVASMWHSRYTQENHLKSPRSRGYRGLKPREISSKAFDGYGIT